MDVQTFAYRPKWGVLWFLLLLSGAGAIFMAYTAATNDRGAIIDHAIELDKGSATVLYGVIAAFCAAGVVMAIMSMIGRVRSPGELILKADELTLPPHPWRSPATVKYADIQGVTMQAMRNGRFVVIKHRGGKLSIREWFFEDKASFEKVCVRLGMGARKAG
ncbi:hypothetical protein [Dyella sp.]|uniref:hypothetical protein n=1 Tax=Dyella sp. TaxID=1869338 RepID=UPI002ED5BD90